MNQETGSARRPPARPGSELALEVLVADDDPLVAEFLCLTLERFGCIPNMVGNGRAALDKLADQHFDVLVTDWLMPEMDGIDLVRRVRALRDDYLHIILMTARDEERTVRTAIDAGVDDFFYKPFTPLQVELGVTAARRVVQLQRRLEQRNRHLSLAHERTRAAFAQVKNDLLAAAVLQKQLLPDDQLSGAFRHASLFTPSLDIGGDMLGVVPVAGGRRLFFDLDVSGHGVPAALNSFSLHSRLSRMAPATPPDLAAAAAILNDELVTQGGDAYMTAVIGLAEADGSRLWIIRAGHPMPILLETGKPARWIEPGGLPLGMLPGIRHDPCELSLPPGSRVLLYSDGATEGGLGEQGLLDAFERQRDSDLATAIGALEWRLLNLRGGDPPTDDISILALERAGTKEEKDR